MKVSEKLISKKEAAEMLSASVRTVERMLATEDLLKIKIRGLVRIKRSQILKMLESGC